MPAGWVEAGAAVLSAGEGIAANQSAASAAKKNNAGAAQLAGAQGTMLNQAQQVAQQPFEAYTGTLSAPMSGNEQAGYDLAKSTAINGQAQGDVASARDLISQVGGSSWNADTAAKYMNPYQKDVTDAALKASNQSYLEKLAGIQTGAAGSGAFGGGRSAIEQGVLSSEQNMNVGSLTATGNKDAYDSAMKAWSADNTTKLNAANAYLKAGSDVTQMTSSQISDLMKTGGVSQVIAQTNLDRQYQQFMRQQGWSAQQLGPLINAVSSAKGGTTQSAPVQSNIGNSLLGLGSTVAGLFGGGSSSGGNSGVPTGDVTGGITYTDPMAGMGNQQMPTMPAIEGS